MKVILKADIKGVGKKDEVINNRIMTSSFLKFEI